MTDAVAIREPDAILPPRPVADLATLLAIRQEWVEYIQRMLVDGVDFYQFEGYAKKALSKAGGENLIKCAGYAVGAERFIERQEQWTDPPFCAYIMEVDIIDRRTGQVVGVGIGEANSHESKYRWRWVPKHQVPKLLDPATLESRDGSITEPKFAIDKGETGGKYGKPPEHWARFREAMAGGAFKETTRQTKAGKPMLCITIGETLFRIPNLDVAGVRNTIIKMCKKRAVVDGALTATGMSGRFTQYEEDEDKDASEDRPRDEVSGGTKIEDGTEPIQVPEAAWKQPGTEDDPRLWVARLVEHLERSGRTEAMVRLHFKKVDRGDILAKMPQMQGHYGEWPMDALVLGCQWLSDQKDKGTE